MIGSRRNAVVAIVFAGLIFATAAAALAETFTLKLKRRETGPRNYDAATYMLWQVQPQYFNMQMRTNREGKTESVNVRGNDQAFKRIVTKEPKYKSEHPFRGVLKFGSQEYAFALDAVPPPEEKKPDAKKSDAKKTEAKTTDGTAAKAESGSLLSVLGGALAGATPAKPPMSLKAVRYNRLYFDANHNGDLTDDKVIEAPASADRAAAMGGNMAYWPVEFPRIDVAIEVDDAKLDYSFHLQGYAYASPTDCQVSVQAMSAICREGDVTLEGRRHHVVLLDFNSNGRFDDEMKVSPDIHLSGGQIYALPGDMMLIDFKPGRGIDSPYDPTGSDFRHYITKTVTIDGQLYDMKVSPAGDKITLTRSALAMGSVTNKNESFTAMIYGDKGFLKIRGAKGKPVAVPEGDWKLYNYTITCAPRPAPAKPVPKGTAAKPAVTAATAKNGSLFDFLANQLGVVSDEDGDMVVVSEGPVALSVAGATVAARPSTVSATGTEGYKAVTVRSGESVEMPFGPPYKPTVEAANYGNPGGKGKQVHLTMKLVGIAGEACTSMTVNGSRPGKPAFTITDPEGKVVQKGSFEYG
jgi:hypothetical protein